MIRLSLMLDTNVVLDFLQQREPYYEKARLLMILGRLGEVRLWLCASQITDIIYVLSNGGGKSELPDVLERIRGIRTFIDIHPVDGIEIDRMLSSKWKDPEDALLYEAALDVKADFIITRNVTDFEGDLVRATTCEQFFDYVKNAYGRENSEIGL